MTSSHEFQPYHLVDMSPWPLTGSISAMIISSVQHQSFNSKMYCYPTHYMSMVTWCYSSSDISSSPHFSSSEGTMVSDISFYCISSYIFLLSFLSFFFRSSLASTTEIGMNWPPYGIQPFNPFQIPLLNTTILLLSGATVTWAHHAIMECNHSQPIQSLGLTIILSFYFTALQASEYIEAPFTIADSVFGLTVFVATGFHGLHVIIGTSFLLICFFFFVFFFFVRNFPSNHYVGFEAAAWYWHFVDAVSLFLYVFINWWGG